MTKRTFQANDFAPAIHRPGMYTGAQGTRSDTQWMADACAAYLNMEYADNTAIHHLQELLENMESPRSRKASIAWDNARALVLARAGQ